MAGSSSLLNDRDYKRTGKLCIQQQNWFLTKRILKSKDIKTSIPSKKTRISFLSAYQYEGSILIPTSPGAIHSAEYRRYKVDDVCIIIIVLIFS